MRLDEERQHSIELSAVGDLGHRVLGHFGMERFALFFERDFRLGVLQQHRRSAQLPVAANDWNRVEVDGDMLSLAAEDFERKLHAAA